MISFALTWGSSIPGTGVGRTMTPGEFAEKVKAVVEPLGGSVTSFGRTVARSILVGSTAQSPHVRWLAMDVVYDSGPNRPGSETHQKYTKATPFSCKVCSVDGLKVLHETTHDHYQVNPLGG